MVRYLRAAVVGAAIVLTGAVALAQGMSSAMPMASGQTMMEAPHARFGGSVYTGAPDLPLTVSMVVAGGGPTKFKTATLVGVLAGSAAKAEVAKLTKAYGAAGVKQYLQVFDFVVADSLKLATKAGVKLPSPSPDPTDGKALATALYQAGVDPKLGYNVEYMLDHLVSHPIHVQVMKDIDAKFGLKADATYHVVTLVVMNDLKKLYNL
ncbi:MAG: hypothetical protein JO101_08270 [Candidatus Eremiobacteraeota bacterium]|nr:hypothetical protein [Candidatus Eremiobacteraeota bacterium]MBV8355299.1 hypothetical protein [Candidatus Eremiobacteraeota bacterium]